MGKLPERIESKTIFIVEGYDEKGFLNAICNSLNIVDYQVFVVEGNPNFRKKIPAIFRLPNFQDIVKNIIIIRDAELDAFSSIVNILRRQSIIRFELLPQTPGEFINGTPNIGIFIIPDNVHNGMLEDLCLQTVINNQSHFDCIDDFLQCLGNYDFQLENRTKVKTQIYMATQQRLVQTVRDAAAAGIWNLESPSLDELKLFLKNIEY